MKRYILLLLLGCLFALCPLLAQDLSEDLEFFQTQSKAYQQWLDKTGLGKALAVQEVSLKKSGSEFPLA